MKTIIAFTGVKQAGKTTSFNILKEYIPELQEIAIADRLKNVCSLTFDVPRNYFDDPGLKELPLETPVYLTSEKITSIIKDFGYTPDFEKHVKPHISIILESPREIAQYVGTDILRKLDNDIHCAGAVLGKPSDGIFVVTDMRFPNEYQFFSSNENFYPFYICNRTAEGKIGPNAHSSEKYVLEMARDCQVIDNNGTLANLRSELVNKILPIIEGCRGKNLSA